MRVGGIYLIFFILLVTHHSAQELISIGIFNSAKITSVKIFFQDNYSLQTDDEKELVKLNKNQFYVLEVKQDSLVLLNNVDGKKIISKKLSFYSPDIKNSQLSIVSNHLKKDRIYKGHLIAMASNGYLKLVNILDLDDYVCGVVNAEVGKGRHPEFYKAQSLLVRTYALSHLYKHIGEGFNLCDEVHCQVYYGVCYSLAILQSVEQTHNLVIVDKDLNLIVAAFHSNSGGQTVNSEDIWGSKKDYLRSVKDTFSIGMPSYYWKKKIPLKEWLNYLSKYHYPVNDSDALKYVLNYKQYSRQTYIQYNEKKILLKNVRDDLKLMSTFFDISLNDKGDSVVFNGKGFGHGVGLSQEGAMRMAQLGWNYKDIVQFYFKNIILMDLKKLNFFKEE